MYLLMFGIGLLLVAVLFPLKFSRRVNRWLDLLLFGAPILLFANSALAATAAPVAAIPGVAIDFGPTISTVVLPFVATLATGVIAWAATMIGARFHIQISAEHRAALNSAITNGISYVQSQLAPGEQITAPSNMAAVVNYVLPKVPDALTWLKVDGDSLAQLILARLPS